jgi:hypothetical protein
MLCRADEFFLNLTRFIQTRALQSVHSHNCGVSRLSSNAWF